MSAILADSYIIRIVSSEIVGRMNSTSDWLLMWWMDDGDGAGIELLGLGGDDLSPVGYRWFPWAQERSDGMIEKRGRSRRKVAHF